MGRLREDAVSGLHRISSISEGMEAVAALEGLTRARPREARFRLALGQAHEASVYHARDTGSRSQADDAYRRAYELDPTNPQARFARAERLLQDLRTEPSTAGAIHSSAALTTNLLSRAFLASLPAEVHLEGNLGSLAPFDPKGAGDTTLSVAVLSDRVDYLGALAAFFIARKVDRDHAIAPPDALPALTARVDALCTAAVQSLDRILARDYAAHDSTFTDHAALLLEGAFACRRYMQTGDPDELRDADQLFDKGVQALQSTDPYRYDCYRIPLDPVTKTYDPRWREAGYPWEVERVNLSQIGPIEAKVRYRYQLFQVDVYFGDVWLELPLDVALRDPLAGVVLYAGYDFVSVEERGGTSVLDVSEGPADPNQWMSPQGLKAPDFGLTRPPEVHGRTGYLPRYRVVNHPLLGRFSVFQDGGARNGLHAHRAMDQVKQTWGPAASIVGPEPETFLRDTWGFLTAVRVDKAAGRGTDPAVSFQIRIPSDADSSSLLLRATLVGPDQKEIATAFAESPHFHEWPGFSREPAEFGGRWVWTSSFRLPDSFVQALSPKGKPCTVRLQLRRGDRSNRSVQVVSGVQVRPFPKNVFCLADPTLPHFGLVRRGANLSAQVHAYENAAAPDSLRIGVPSGFEMPAGSAKRRDDGSYEVLIRPGDGFVSQTLHIFAADGSTTTPLLTRRNAFFLSDPHGFWGGGRARTVTAVDFPTSNLPAGQCVAVLTWHDAVSKVSSSASTAFTVFEDLAAESAETGTRAATSP